MKGQIWDLILPLTISRGPPWSIYSTSPPLSIFMAYQLSTHKSSSQEIIPGVSYRSLLLLFSSSRPIHSIPSGTCLCASVQIQGKNPQIPPTMVIIILTQCTLQTRFCTSFPSLFSMLTIMLESHYYSVISIIPGNIQHPCHTHIIVGIKPKLVPQSWQIILRINTNSEKKTSFFDCLTSSISLTD